MDGSLKRPTWDEVRLRAASNAAGLALWSWNVTTGEVEMEEHGRILWGVQQEGLLSFTDLLARVHPEDRDRVATAFDRVKVKPGRYEIDFRVLRDSGTGWLSARGCGDEEGSIEGSLFGVVLDVTERRQAEEARELLASEMSHRVKNLFAIASSLTVIAARSAATTTEMAHDLSQRLITLARAHDLIRPDPKRPGHQAAFLAELLTAFLAPYDERGIIGDRIRVSVPHVSVGETATTTLALVVHELATNSVKYGALSVAGGTLDVSCADMGDQISLAWMERGGPPVRTPIGAGGFGSKLISQSLCGQLAGSVTFDWQHAGVVVTLRISKTRLG